MMIATPTDTRRLSDLVAALAARHERLCPRQVLGARIGIAGLAALGVEYSPDLRSVLAFVETDGCFVSGVEVATGCCIGHRTLQVRDQGKVAAVFLEPASGRAFRVVPRAGIRSRAAMYSDDTRRYYAQLEGYQRMPLQELLEVRPVRLREDLEALVGRRGVRVDCAVCGEEILNNREVLRGARALCRACAEGAYFEPLTP